jgi:hypothetical protein
VDVQRLLAAADTNRPQDVRDRALLMLLAIYGLRTSEVTALRLGHDDDIFTVGAAHGERRAPARAQRRVARLGAQLEVLRVVLLPPDDDHVFQTTGDNHPAVTEKAEIAGAEERSIAALGEPGAERLGRERRLAPVSMGDARAGDPDLADAVRRAALPRDGVGDHHPDVLGGPPARRQADRVVTRRVADPVSRERARTDSVEARLVTSAVARDGQRGLGQAVHGQEGLPPEAGGTEGREESMERFGSDRLGAVVGDAPAPEIQRS